MPTPKNKTRTISKTVCCSLIFACACVCAFSSFFARTLLFPFKSSQIESPHSCYYKCIRVDLDLTVLQIQQQQLNDNSQTNVSEQDKNRIRITKNRIEIIIFRKKKYAELIKNNFILNPIDWDVYTRNADDVVNLWIMYSILPLYIFIIYMFL